MEEDTERAYNCDYCGHIKIPISMMECPGCKHLRDCPGDEFGDHNDLKSCNDNIEWIS